MKKDHPIIFSTPMVQAILEGRKTQTRRTVKPQPIWNFPSLVMKGEDTDEGYWKLSPNDNPVKCPYGKAGDVLWVKEAYFSAAGTDPQLYVYRADWVKYGNEKNAKWKPSIFMPKEASRIFLEVTNIVVERLQDISEEDAESEGVIPFKKNYDDRDDCWTDGKYKTAYEYLWNEINGWEPNSWNQNQFVWVIEFKILSQHNTVIHECIDNKDGKK